MHGQGKHPAVNKQHLKQNGYVWHGLSSTGFPTCRSSGIFTDKETRLQLELESVEALSRNEATRHKELGAFAIFALASQVLPARIRPELGMSSP